MEVTGEIMATSEWQAHYDFRRQHEGREALSIQPELDIDTIVSDILTPTANSPRIIHIAGRSGSGKSTIVKQLRKRLDELNINSITMSTDDYHRGATYLYYYNDRQEWQHWDDPFVYDTETMAVDLQNLINNKASLSLSRLFTIHHKKSNIDSFFYRKRYNEIHNSN